MMSLVDYSVRLGWSAPSWQQSLRLESILPLLPNESQPFPLPPIGCVERKTMGFPEQVWLG